MVKVSVVIPTHNRADLLPRAIKSVLNQTFKDFEVIVVSDGSTDETDTIMSEIVNSDERIKYINYSPGRGGNYARNAGIKAAKGEYVGFLDDDDEWLPEKLEKQMLLFDNKKNTVLVYTGVHIIYVNEKTEYSFIPKQHGDLSHTILLDNCIGSTSTPLVRKTVFEKAGVFDNDLGALQDYDLWIRIAQYGDIEVVSEELINYYNYRGTKQVSAVTEKYEQAFAYINNKYKNLFASLTDSENRIKQVNEFILLGNKAMRNRENKKARHYYRKVLKTNFSLKNLVFYIMGFTNYDVILKLRNLI